MRRVIDPAPEPGAGFGLGDLPAAVGFDPVVVAGVGSEVPNSGLAGRPAFVGVQVGMVWSISIERLTAAA